MTGSLLMDSVGKVDTANWQRALAGLHASTAANLPPHCFQMAGFAVSAQPNGRLLRCSGSGS
ncbi:MAG: hypothetical protein ACE5NP_08325 [Anaerolineae bacterium]